LGLSNFFGSITQVYKRFLIYSISPLFYNLGIILGIIFLYPVFGLPGLVYGVVLGAFLHLLIQIPFVIKQGIFALDYFLIICYNVRLRNKLRE
jgi:putative peptidoglycan lipid II flippase